MKALDVKNLVPLQYLINKHVLNAEIGGMAEWLIATYNLFVRKVNAFEGSNPFFLR